MSGPFAPQPGMTPPGGPSHYGAQPGAGPGQRPPQGWPPAWQQPPVGPYAPGPSPASVPPTTPPKKPTDVRRLAAAALGVLGVLNVVWGFLPAISSGGNSMSVFTVGAGSVWLTVFACGAPIVLFIAGLLAVGSSLTGRRSAGTVVVLSLLGVLAALVTLTTDGLDFSFGRISGGSLSSGVDRGIGLILLLIFAAVQAATALYAWLLDAGLVGDGPNRGGAAMPGPAQAPAMRPAPWAPAPSAPPVHPAPPAAARPPAPWMAPAGSPYPAENPSGAYRPPAQRMPAPGDVPSAGSAPAPGPASGSVPPAP